jgi:hypothetical protein
MFEIDEGIYFFVSFVDGTGICYYYCMEHNDSGPVHMNTDIIEAKKSPKLK